MCHAGDNAESTKRLFTLSTLVARRCAAVNACRHARCERHFSALASYGEGTVCLISLKLVAGVGGQATSSYSSATCGAAYLLTDRQTLWRCDLYSERPIIKIR